MAFRPHHSWIGLVGEWVLIRRSGRDIDEGFVDAVTEDDQILWLAQEGVDSRRLVTRAADIEVWVDHKWEAC